MDAEAKSRLPEVIAVTGDYFSVSQNDHAKRGRFHIGIECHPVGKQGDLPGMDQAGRDNLLEAGACSEEAALCLVRAPQEGDSCLFG